MSMSCIAGHAFLVIVLIFSIASWRIQSQAAHFVREMQERCPILRLVCFVVSISPSARLPQTDAITRRTHTTPRQPKQDARYARWTGY
jgi:hypothetical protein